jgi:hypothetical protein
MKYKLKTNIYVKKKLGVFMKNTTILLVIYTKNKPNAPIMQRDGEENLKYSSTFIEMLCTKIY